VPLWAGRCWLPAPSLSALCSRLNISLPEPIGFATERASPAYYVELRALDIARDEQKLSTPHAHHRPPIKPLKLLWPFRWPVPVAAVPVAPSSPASAQGSQQSVNLLI